MRLLVFKAASPLSIKSMKAERCSCIVSKAWRSRWYTCWEFPNRSLFDRFVIRGSFDTGIELPTDTRSSELSQGHPFAYTRWHTESDQQKPRKHLIDPIGNSFSLSSASINLSNSLECIAVINVDPTFAINQRRFLWFDFSPSSSSWWSSSVIINVTSITCST